MRSLVIFDKISSFGHLLQALHTWNLQTPFLLKHRLQILLMEELADVGFEVKEDQMISLNGGAKPTTRLAHFLKPTVSFMEGSVFELPSDCLSSLPAIFEPKKWPLKVNFHGWRSPQKAWKRWVEKMAALHESTWKKAGIYEAILNSTYEIQKNYDLVLGLAEKWCPKTKSFIFSWGEATITLEDVMISGYSVLGSSVLGSLQTDALKEIEEKLNQARMKLARGAAKKPGHCAWMKKFMDSESEIEHEAFLALWLSRFVLPSSFNTITKSVFPVAVHLAGGAEIALAPAILASIYRDMSMLKEKIVALNEIDNWDNECSRAVVTLLSPLQLVQIWAWERFIELRGKPNLIRSGETRFARWHEIMFEVENVRVVLDSAKYSFHWRPYVRTVENWHLPEFYGEKEMWVAVDVHLSEELQSFAQCLRVSELVGIDCIELYLPHRVAMQFGMDQDLPARVVRANESPHIAWSYYSKPIGYANLYVPSRFYEAEVTTRYLDWWMQSLESLRRASDCQKSHPRYPLKSYEKSLESSGRKKRCIDVSATHGHPSKMAKRSVEASKEKKIVVDAYASAELPSISLEVKKEADDSPFPPGFPPKCNLVEAKDSAEDDCLTIAQLFKPSQKLSASLVVKNKAKGSPVPLGFVPRSYSVEAMDYIEEDTLTIQQLLKSRKKLDGILKGQVNSAEKLTGQSEKFSASGECEDDKVIESHVTSKQKIMRKKPMKVGSETAMVGLTDCKAGRAGHDKVRMLGGEGDGIKCASDQTERLEEWVSMLENKIAELKAERFRHEGHS